MAGACSWPAWVGAHPPHNGGSLRPLGSGIPVLSKGPEAVCGHLWPAFLGIPSRWRRGTGPGSGTGPAASPLMGSPGQGDGRTALTEYSWGDNVLSPGFQGPWARPTGAPTATCLAGLLLTWAGALVYIPRRPTPQPILGDCPEGPSPSCLMVSLSLSHEARRPLAALDRPQFPEALDPGRRFSRPQTPSFQRPGPRRVSETSVYMRPLPTHTWGDLSFPSPESEVYLPPP